MSQQKSLRESIRVLTAGLVACTLLYLAYQEYTTRTTNSPSLHRSNAIRRPRRRWQRGHAPRELDHDPTARAIRNLSGRIAARQPYGRYENYLLFGDRLSQTLLDDGRLDLLPQNLGPMFRELATFRDFTVYEAQTLNHHIESMFIQNFLVQEFPAGYIIGDDAESLVHVMRSHGIAEDVVRSMIDRFDTQKSLTPVNWNLGQDMPSISPGLTGADAAQQSNADEEDVHGALTNRAIAEDYVTPQDAIDALVGQAQHHRGDNGWTENDEQDSGGSQGMLDLLYHIAGEQAKREGIVHRGVRCDSCGVLPIRGIRYHCANCFKFDLCESCEAQQVHNKTHVFYKIRIPTPLRGHVKQVSPVWYPGNPYALPNSIPKHMSKHLKDLNQVDKTVLDSYYEQFKYLAGQSLPQDSDPARLGMAISRKNFDLYFTTTSDDRPPPQNLLYDRIFAFYDTNDDDLITFDEFVKGMVSIQNKTRAARVERMFRGYDLDNDGYVDRKDFLRIFRAYYAWHKDFGREMIKAQGELEDDIRDAVQGSQPISAAFGWNDFTPHASRGSRDKQVGIDGDLQIVAGPDSVLQNETAPKEDRAAVISNAEVYSQMQPFGVVSKQHEVQFDDPQFDILPSERFDDAGLVDDAHLALPLHIHRWPPLAPVTSEDVISALGADVSWEEIMDPTDRARVIEAQAKRLAETAQQIGEEAVADRWRRRQFYLDEQEGMSRPPGFMDPDSSEEEDNNQGKEGKQKKTKSGNQKTAGDGVDSHAESLQSTMSSRRQSMRSRSSSKVRFDDSAIDTDYETRSNTSSRSIPMNERWGGYELGEAERDMGKEILYQTVQHGFNELLDPFFRQKESEGLEALASKSLRRKWKVELDAYEKSQSINGGVSRGPSPSFAVHTIDDKHARTPKNRQRVPELAAQQVELSNGKGPAADRYEGSPVCHQDPMLPQHRPNDSHFLDSVFDGEELDGRQAIVGSIEHPPVSSLLQVWYKHRMTDREAEERDGYGKLSFQEFKHRLLAIELGSGDDDFARPYTSTTTPSYGETGSISWETHIEEDEQEIWNSTAGLGRLSFLSSWLEMGQF